MYDPKTGDEVLLKLRIDGREAIANRHRLPELFWRVWPRPMQLLGLTSWEGMSSEFVWMTVTRSWTATVLNVDTDNDVMEISNFEESTSTNGHKTTKYADVAGTDGRTVLETPLRSLVFF